MSEVWLHWQLLLLYCTILYLKSDNVIVTLFFDHFGQNLEYPFLWTNSDTETAFTQTDLLWDPTNHLYINAFLKVF